MEYLLNPDTGLIVWTIVTFLGLVFVLGKFAWKPLIGALNERESGIRRAIDEADNARKTAEGLRARYEAELAQGQGRVQAMLAKAEADAQGVRDKILKDADETARRLAEQTRRQLDEDRAALSRELRREIAGLSVRATEKLLRHAMNAKEQEKLVNEFLKDLEKEPPAG